MPWIHKRLQVNPGSYGILGLDAGNGMEGGEFTFTVYGYIDAGGKNEHNNFTLDVDNAIEVANTLLEYVNSRDKTLLEERGLLTVEQEYILRGTLYISIGENKALRMGIGTYQATCAAVTLNKKQARKVAGYLFFWAGAEMLGKRKVVVPERKARVLDINDIIEVKYESWGALEE